jgi:hypothetical protein
MASANIPLFPELDLQPRETAPVRFIKYVRRLENLFLATAISDPARQKAMFLHYIGEQANDVCETLKMPNVDTDNLEVSDVFKCTIKAFKDYFEPQRCTDHVNFMTRIWR